MAVLSFIGYLTIDPVFLFLGATPDLLPLIHSYLDIYYPTMLLFTLTMVAGNIMRANGDANIPGLVMTLGALANLAIDPILIFGWFGLPRMELAGAAVAAAISRLGTAAVLIYFVHRGGLITTSNLAAGFASSTRRITSGEVRSMVAMRSETSVCCSSGSPARSRAENPLGR